MHDTSRLQIGHAGGESKPFSWMRRRSLARGPTVEHKVGGYDAKKWAPIRRGMGALMFSSIVGCGSYES